MSHRFPLLFPTVHPHACGEHISDALDLRVTDGSSPRMWGTLINRTCINTTKRFIPTHVGEHSDHFGPRPKMFGSSPRMWGTRVLKESSPSDDRFIPTHGNTDGMTATPPSSVGSSPRMWGTHRVRRHPWASVHPHACGEHPAPRHLSLGADGSSPRMWGTPRASGRLHPGRRFIPTHVGNTGLSLIYLIL